LITSESNPPCNTALTRCRFRSVGVLGVPKARPYVPWVGAMAAGLGQHELLRLRVSSASAAQPAAEPAVSAAYTTAATAVMLLGG
jgi:hypothetical protein